MPHFATNLIDILLMRLPAIFSTVVLLLICRVHDLAAQQIVATVNRQSFTAECVEGHTRFVQLAKHITLTRQEAVEELINDMLKLQFAESL